MRAVFACLLLVSAAQAASWAIRKVDPRGQPVRRNFPVNSGRIIGGETATPGQFNHHVGILSGDGNLLCSGSLITKYVVLTAASCIFYNPREWFLHFGAHALDNHTEPGRVIVMSRDGLVHENYNSMNSDNDIGVIYMRQEITTGPKIDLVRLPSRSQDSENFVGAIARFSGWGETNRTKEVYSPELLFADLTINRQGGFLLFVANNGTTEPCWGDIGGALTITESDGLPTQVGISSSDFQTYCDGINPPRFSRLTKYLDWLEYNAFVTIRP